MDYIPEGWNLPEDNSHDETLGFGIAGTYHIFRQADGFVTQKESSCDYGFRHDVCF